MRVNPFCQGHSAGMTDNFFDGSLIDMCFGEQGNRGVPAAVRCMIDADETSEAGKHCGNTYNR